MNRRRILVATGAGLIAAWLGFAAGDWVLELMLGIGWRGSPGGRIKTMGGLVAASVLCLLMWMPGPFTAVLCYIRLGRLEERCTCQKCGHVFAPRWYLEPRLEPGICIALSALITPVFLSLSIILASRVGFLFDVKVPNAILVSVVCVMVVGMTYIGARATYALLRWKRVLYDGTRCSNCGYNLTGNVTGVCSECGKPI